MKRNFNYYVISAFVILFLMIIFIKVMEEMWNYSIWFMKAFGVCTTIGVIFLFIALLLIYWKVKEWWNNRGKK